MTEEIETIKFSNLVKWTAKQKEVHESTKKFKYILYGGAMGGGKSFWLRWELLRLLLYYYAKYDLKGVVVGLFCEDYPSLKDRHLSKIKYEFPAWLGDFNTQDHNFILKKDFGEGVLAFRNLDDPSKYQSSEFATEGVDELTKNKKDTFDFLRTRLRWPGIPTFDTKFLAGTNPGGIGHEWVKKLWIDRDFDSSEQEKELFTFIQAKAKDNPHLDEGYYKSLESLPMDLRRAFLEGDWDIFKGQYFKEWRREIHIVNPFEIPMGWKRFISIDYGFAKPSAVHWNAVDREGNFYIYRELYETELTYSALCKMIISMTPDNEIIDYWVGDPSMWAKKGETELSGAEIIEQTYREKYRKMTAWGQEVINELRFLKGNNDRINGWRVIREYLKPIMKQDKLSAKLQVFSNCENFIRTFPSLVYDPIRVEDLDTEGEDHSADSLRYAVMTKPTIQIDYTNWPNEPVKNPAR
jgi:phage terminase large subunit